MRKKILIIVLITLLNSTFLIILSEGNEHEMIYESYIEKFNTSMKGDTINYACIIPNESINNIFCCDKIVIDTPKKYEDTKVLDHASNTQVSKAENNSLFLCHVYITGHGPVYIAGSFLRQGYGFCLFMKINLESDGYVEIYKLKDSNNTILLNGNQTITLIGFFGLFNNGGCNGDYCYPMEIDCKALFCKWI